MRKFDMKLHGRPKIRRYIESGPKIGQFSPRGRAGRPDAAYLEIDQYEAIRLADLRGLSQVDAAKCMAVSQQTFSRILQRARAIIADAIVNGKIIYIHGKQDGE